MHAGKACLLDLQWMADSKQTTNPASFLHKKLTFQYSLGNNIAHHGQSDFLLKQHMLLHSLPQVLKGCNRTLHMCSLVQLNTDTYQRLCTSLKLALKWVTTAPAGASVSVVRKITSKSSLLFKHPKEIISLGIWNGW